MKGKDSVTAENPNITIISGEDGICSNNDSDSEKGTIVLKDGTYTITAEEDGIQAETALEILGGTYEITTGGGSENGTKSITFGEKMERPEDGMMEKPEDGMMEKPEDGMMEKPEDGMMEKPEDGMMEKPEDGTLQKPGGEYTPADAVSAASEETDVSRKGIKSGTQLVIELSLIHIFSYSG